LSGDISPGWGIVFVILELCVTCGGGLMLIIFDPGVLIDLNIFALHRLVEPKRERKSFADRIHVDEDDS